MNIPKVSVIVPIYNVERYLSRCMDSLLNQTMQEIEIILVDDGSPDSCPSMCDEYAQNDNRIRVVHKRNAGLGLARNSGLEIAQGEYVAFIDSDDYIDETFLEKLYTVASQYDVQAAYCGINTVNSGNKIINRRKEVPAITLFEGNQECRRIGLDMVANPEKVENSRFMMSVWHSIFKLDFLLKHEIKFCSERDFISEDMIFDIDFFSVAERVVYIPDCLYYYCHNESSLSRKFNIMRYKRNIIHYRELLRRMPLRGFNKDEINSAHKYLIWVIRNFLYTLYREPIPISDKRKVLKNILESDVWNEVSRSSVINILPKKPALFYYCFINKKKFLLESLIKIANLKYK